jgi:hypothetical protein
MGSDDERALRAYGNADSDGYGYSNSHIYANGYRDIDSNRYRNSKRNGKLSYSVSYGYGNAFCDRYGYGYRDCDGNGYLNAYADYQQRDLRGITMQDSACLPL